MGISTSSPPSLEKAGLQFRRTWLLYAQKKNYVFHNHNQHPGYVPHLEHGDRIAVFFLFICVLIHSSCQIILLLVVAYRCVVLYVCRIGNKNRKPLLIMFRECVIIQSQEMLRRRRGRKKRRREIKRVEVEGHHQIKSKE